jgi:hypothetical protein
MNRYNAIVSKSYLRIDFVYTLCLLQVQEVLVLDYQGEVEWSRNCDHDSRKLGQWNDSATMCSSNVPRWQERRLREIRPVSKGIGVSTANVPILCAANHVLTGRVASLKIT